ncbi:WD repeat-containing protein 47 isoform X4 [Anopheles darlingi]|uniref:WD repeat-containing protein 47 isoform X4 n=1 Tax=Anopheles darlingi TaxID=43151 RepID=UPI0020FFF5E8|nr:WD repeat-containing protein 47 isoform X4 [Anopheles darlingi]
MANLHHAHHHHALHRHRPFCGVDRQLRKIEEIFSQNQKENDDREVKIIESRTSRHCSVHGSHRRGSVCSVKRRDSIASSIGDLSSVSGPTAGTTGKQRASYGSIYNVGREAEMAARRRSRLGNRNSIANFSDLQLQYGGGAGGSRRNLTGVGIGRRDSMPARSLQHPADFPSMLRGTSVSTVDLRRKPSIGGLIGSSGPGVTRRASMNNNNNNSSKRRSLNLDDSLSSAKLHSILKKASSSSKDSEDSGEHDALCDMTKRLSFDSGIAKLPPVLANNRRNSNDSSYSSFSRRISIDSLDAGRRYSRRLSDASSLFGGDEDAASSAGSTGGGSTTNDLDRIKVLNSSFANSFDRETSDHEQSDQNRPRFVAVTTLEDVQAVRCAEFHPNGRIYAVGSNSKTFRICEYPSLSEIREDHSTYQPTVLFKRTKHHKGSIYCMAWSPAGDLIATGSNDKTVKLMRFNESQKQLEGQEMELTMHDGTVRDLCFLEDSSNKSSLLISGGAGDCKIYVTDCETSTPFQALSGHGGHVLSLYNWGGVMFVSGSQDKTVRFWDLRTRGCVNMVTPATSPGSRQGSPVAAVCVDPSGRLLVSGHEDSSCVLYDIRGNRPIQCFKPHSSDVRSIRFSPSAYYLLTAGYDNKLVLTDLQGDLTMPLPSVVVAQHTDKVISGRWHPVDFSFLSTSADKTATLWALPPI